MLTIDGKLSYKDGFAALVSVILLAAGTTAFSLSTMASAYSYADSVNRRELRIQASLNAGACLDTARLMVAKDNFFTGTTTIPYFGCEIIAVNDSVSSVSLNVTARFEGVSVQKSGIALY
ncbi:hypothetical protein KGQ27_01805 [Patescibacteria group bacterium]|nr:hypothetical protein [Patescibacteria group bacterium]MDE2233267.1 hypothetical protein [Patescibacteria group bacterium]